MDRIPWSRGREVARGILRSSPKPNQRPLFAIGEESRIFVACFLHSSAQKMCLYQTPGRRPPPITGRFVNTVTRGWVGAPNERAPSRFHGAVVGFVDQCLSRTQNLAASNKHLAEFFSGRSWPKIGPGIFFFGVFEKFEPFFRRFVLIASGTEILRRLALKFKLFMETSRFHCHRSYKIVLFPLLCAMVIMVYERERTGIPGTWVPIYQVHVPGIVAVVLTLECFDKKLKNVSCEYNRLNG